MLETSHHERNGSWARIKWSVGIIRTLEFSRNFLKRKRVDMSKPMVHAVQKLQCRRYDRQA
jgi:hypothetical protein